MADFTLRQLEHFLAVVDEGSVTGAAQVLHVSPGGISVSLDNLEASLGLQLTLRRRGRGAAITPAGQWVAAKARAVLDGAVNIQQAAKAFRGELTGPLRVGCFGTLSPWLFPRIAEHFSTAHPGVGLELTEGASSDLQQRLQRGDLDVALLYRNHLETGIDGVDVVPVRLQLAFAPDHPLAALEKVPLRKLEGEDAILLNVQPSMSHVEEILRGAGLVPRVRWRSTNVETIRSMVARGLGYTVIMGRPYGDFTYDGLPIAYRRIADAFPENAVTVAFPQGTEPTAKVRALIEFCRSEFGAEGHAGVRPSGRDGMGELSA